jgi:hypothetical protein
VDRPARFLGTLAAALGLAAACLAPLAFMRLGVEGLQAVLLSAVACFIPGVVLTAVGGKVTGSQRSLFLLLIGAGLRVGMVLTAALLLVEWRPALKSIEFFLGLAVLYGAALVVETRALLEVAAAPRRDLTSAAAVRPSAEVGHPLPRQPQST